MRKLHALDDDIQELFDKGEYDQAAELAKKRAEEDKDEDDGPFFENPQPRNLSRKLNEKGKGLCNEHKDAEAIQLFRLALDLNNKNTEAMVNMGIMYQNGTGVEQDPAKAFEYYMAAAEGGAREGMYNAGRMLQTGEGAEKDEVRGISLLHQAADRGHVDAMIRLSNYYYYKNDSIRRFTWIEKAADRGNESAEKFLAQNEGWQAWLAAQSALKNKNYQEAFAQASKAANYGIGEAICVKAALHMNGDGTEKDVSKAFKEYSLAAEHDIAEGMYTLAIFYNDGDVCERDYAKALAWAEKAKAAGEHAERIDPLIKHIRINIAFENVSKSDSKEDEIKYLEEAAELGSSSAMFYLAADYAMLDYGKTLEWAEKAKAAGFVSDENHNLDKMLEALNRVKPAAYEIELANRCADDSEKLKHYEKAAEYGNSNAMLVCVDWYATGTGCTKDLNKALEWAERAKTVHEDPEEVEEYIKKIKIALAFENTSKSDSTEDQIKYLEEAAKLGSSDAMVCLAGIYSKMDYGKALEWAEKAKAAGFVSDENHDLDELLEALNEADPAAYEIELANCCADDSEKLKHYEKAAEYGDSIAMLRVAIWYERGKGCTQDFNKALEWAEKARIVYENPEEVEEFIKEVKINIALENAIKSDDTEGHVKYLKEAVELGSIDAMYYLARFYTEIDYGKALEWAEKAKAAGFVSDEDRDLDKLLEKLKDVTPADYEISLGDRCTDNSEKLQHYEKAAEYGDSLAMLQVAIWYGHGIGCTKNLNKALEWAEKAKAADGDDSSVYEPVENIIKNIKINIAFENVQKTDSPEEQEKYMKEAAELGSAAAMYFLARAHYNWNEYDEALEWAEKAKAADDNNEIKANLDNLLKKLHNLGPAEIELSMGNKCTDDKEALQHYEKAAGYGNAEAMFRVSICYMKGRGCEQDLRIALEYAERAKGAGYRGNGGYSVDEHIKAIHLAVEGKNPNEILRKAEYRDTKAPDRKHPLRTVMIILIVLGLLAGGYYVATHGLPGANGGSGEKTMQKEEAVSEAADEAESEAVSADAAGVGAESEDVSTVAADAVEEEPYYLKVFSTSNDDQWNIYMELTDADGNLLPVISHNALEDRESIKLTDYALNDSNVEQHLSIYRVDDNTVFCAYRFGVDETGHRATSWFTVYSYDENGFTEVLRGVSGFRGPGLFWRIDGNELDWYQFSDAYAEYGVEFEETTIQSGPDTLPNAIEVTDMDCLFRYDSGDAYPEAE